MRMNSLALVLAVLLLPLSQATSARVYMCVDPQTGATSFTDRACDKVSTGEEVKVNDTNYASGRQSASGSGNQKVWNSHRDERKSGRDYNDERRRLYQQKASASVNGG